MSSRGNGAKAAGTAPEIPLTLIKDLAATLARDQAVYMKLGPEGAVLSVKGAQSYAFGADIGPEWTRMSPEERARAVLGWIRKAAKCCRNPRIRWGLLGHSRPRPEAHGEKA